MSTPAGQSGNTDYEPPQDCEGGDIFGGEDIKTHATNNATIYFGATIVLGIIVVVMIFLMLFGKLHFGSNTTSKYSSTFVPQGIIGRNQSNFGNYPNWYMQDGCAGYNCNVDTDSGRSLGFGISNFDPKKSNFGPLPGVRQHMSVSTEAQRKAVSDLLQKSNMTGCHNSGCPAAKHEHMRLPHQISHMANKREHMTADEQKAQDAAMNAYQAARSLDEVGARQNRVLAGCANAWDPMATEEAKVLGSVGVFKQATPGMSSFSKAINDNLPLTDAQLEAIMQGGEPYTIAPAGLNDSETLAAQQRQQQIMTPHRSYV